MVEHESHSHGHHTGLPWLDLIAAGSAVFISIGSLIVSIHHGRTMEKLVAANEKQVEAATLPILRFTTGNVVENSKVITFDLRNGGTGPATAEWLRNSTPTRGLTVLYMARAKGLRAVGKIRSARGPARNRQWCAIKHRAIDWAARSSSQRSSN